MIFLQEFCKSRALRYFLYQVFRELSHRSNSFLFEAGLFTSTHSFTVSLGCFVDPEKEDMIWKMGDGLPLVPTSVLELGHSLWKKGKAERLEGRDGRQPSFQQHFTCVKLQQRVHNFAHILFYGIILLATTYHFLNIFWLSLIISIWICCKFCLGIYHKTITWN